MKRILSLILLLSFLISVYGRDFSYTYNGNTLTYTVVDEEAKTCMTKSGNYRVPGNWVYGKLVLPSEVKYNEETYTLVSLGEYAFSECENLISVIIPSSVISIGDFAFSNCSGLTTVDLPNSLTSIGGLAFYNCSGLTTVDLPNSLISVGSYAFEGCNGLTSITLPSSVASITNNAFFKCAYLNEIIVEEGNEKFCSKGGIVYNKDYNEILFFPSGRKGDFVIPDNITSIGDYAFYSCSVLTSITIPSSVTSIGDYAFGGCSCLTSINIPSCVTSIGDYAFSGCSGLPSINIPSSVTSIGDHAFYSCSGLTSINTPSSVTSIGDYAFGGCSCLTSINIPSSVTSIGDYAFFSCSVLTSITIPSSVTSIGDWAFDHCTNLKEFIINDGTDILDFKGDRVFDGVNLEIVYLGRSFTCVIDSYMGPRDDSPFSGQKSLAKVTIGNLVTTIPYEAFSGCSGLTSIEIPSSVTTIEDYAFSGCRGLKELIIDDSSDLLNFKGERVFYHVELETIYLGRSFTGIYEDEYDMELSPFFEMSSITSLIIGPMVTSIGDTAFFGCSGLTFVELPHSLTSIGKYAFASCNGLTSITIPESVTSIGDCAFKSCENLKKLYFNAINCEYCGREEINAYWNVEKKYHAFDQDINEVYIGKGVKHIPNLAFVDLSNLTSIEIPSSVESIGEDAFKGCTGLSSVITSSIESWMNIEFKNTYSNPTYYAKKLLANGESIRKLTIPEGIKRISSYAFINCEPLLTVNFPSTIQSVGNYAFSGCSGLQRDLFPSVESFLGIEYDSQFAKFTYRNNSKVYIGSEEFIPVELVWPDSMTRIPAYALWGYKDLKELTIPPTVNEIGKGAFGECNMIKDIVIPDGVKIIEDKTFYCCYGLASISLPASITSIGDNAFSSCSKLKKVKISDVEKWSKINFSSYDSNPIFYSGSFTVGEEEKPFNHLDLDLGEDSVSQFAFINSKNLETIRVKAKKIGNSAFEDCMNVKQLCIDVDELSEFSFGGSTHPETVYCINDNPPTAFDNTFSNYAGVNLFVPYGSAAKYEAADVCWWRFLDIYESDFLELDRIFTPYSEGTSGIPDMVEVDLDLSNENIDIFSINGDKIGTSFNSIVPGIYIIRQGNTFKKILVK